MNRKSIDQRQIDVFTGLSKGLVADGRINQMEAEVLQCWLEQNRHVTDHPVVGALTERVNVMLADRVLDAEEEQELIALLREFIGEDSALGEVAQTTSLPLSKPEPELVFAGRSYLFTGTFGYGTRKECQKVVTGLGGLNAKSVTKTLDYLVLGTYVTDSWAHETFGRKIQRAMDYQQKGVPIAIVSENHWVRCAKIQ